jgi:hypothetical protein
MQRKSFTVLDGIINGLARVLQRRYGFKTMWNKTHWRRQHEIKHEWGLVIRSYLEDETQSQTNTNTILSTQIQKTQPARHTSARRIAMLKGWLLRPLPVWKLDNGDIEKGCVVGKKVQDAPLSLRRGGGVSLGSHAKVHRQSLSISQRIRSQVSRKKRGNRVAS